MVTVAVSSGRQGPARLPCDACTKWQARADVLGGLVTGGGC